MRRVLIALCTALCVLSASPRVSAQTASQGHQASFSGTDAILVAASYGMFSQLVMEDIDRPQFLRTDAAQKNVDFVFGFYRSVKHDAASAAQIEKLRPVLRGEAQFNRGEAASSFSNLESASPIACSRNSSRPSSGAHSPNRRSSTRPTSNSAPTICNIASSWPRRRCSIRSRRRSRRPEWTLPSSLPMPTGTSSKPKRERSQSSSRTARSLQ